MSNSWNNQSASQMLENTLNVDSNLRFDLAKLDRNMKRLSERSGGESYYSLLNDAYEQRKEHQRKLAQNQCDQQADNNLLCSRDRRRHAIKNSNIFSLQYETPSGYYESSALEEGGIFGNLERAWNVCAATGDNDTDMRGCVKGSYARNLVQDGKACSKVTETSSGNLISRALTLKPEPNPTPVMCEGSVSQTSSYYRINPSIRSEFNRELNTVLAEQEREMADRMASS